MTTSLSSSRLTAALLETPSDTSRLATCPLRHTPHASLTREALQAGGDWRCVRCGQQWDARRLAQLLHMPLGLRNMRALNGGASAPPGEAQRRSQRRDAEGLFYRLNIIHVVANGDAVASAPAGGVA
jgi:hypothetical protein